MCSDFYPPLIHFYIKCITYDWSVIVEWRTVRCRIHVRDTLSHFIIPHILITINRLIWLDNGYKSGGIWFLFHEIWFLSCVIMCSDFYPLSNQINLFMVINIWDIIIYIYCMLVREISLNASFAGNRYNVVFKYLRQRSNGLRICLPAVFYIYVFSWFHSV
jgi:hypothetical protein